MYYVLELISQALSDPLQHPVNPHNLKRATPLSAWTNIAQPPPPHELLYYILIALALLFTGVLFACYRFLFAHPTHRPPPDLPYFDARNTTTTTPSAQRRSKFRAPTNRGEFHHRTASSDIKRMEEGEGWDGQ
ncbi:hypothetical protein BS50DRAFT_351011 [Corynespora cassiicola Philippines]|uniref:Uncharacterized protein n=1 Tax=Corynespora cassiicola Philippines TaxID=1448308 RepID=A0A2T2NR48_CORCC|nr:hypothetical protein BS50DRAFT_351011 [Corynespora cassiicola Philippines]